MDWNSFFKFVAAVGTFGAAFAWLVRRVIQYYLNKDIEQFKSQLKLGSDKEVENLKSRLQIEAQRRLVEYSSLHQERASLIAELYERLFEINRRLKWIKTASTDPKIVTMAANIKEEGIEDYINESKKELQMDIERLNKFCMPKQIYFDLEVCNLIEKFVTTAGYVSILATSLSRIADNGRDGEEFINNITAPIEEALDLLEDEFRVMLGVEDREVISPPTDAA